MSDFNKQVIADFNSSNGKPGGYFKDAPILLLHSIGAKSGLERTQPLMFLKEEAQGPWFVFASYGGGPNDPAWFRNVVANPELDISVGDGTSIERTGPGPRARRRRARHDLCPPGGAVPAVRRIREEDHPRHHPGDRAQPALSAAAGNTKGAHRAPFLHSVA